jgi:hypothetical protein
LPVRLPRSWREGLELSSRLGYAARGAVYLMIGVIAVLAAADLTPQTTGADGVFELWARWPLGLVLISVLAACLIAFSAWRVLQAVFDADHHGVTVKAWAIRAGQAVSGLVYGALALSALELLDGLEDIGEADETDSARTAAAEILAWPHGDWLVIAGGLALLAVGVGNLAQGALQDFGKRLRCGPELCRWVVPLGRAGYIGRGLATLPLGVFLLRAGWEVRSSEVRTWAGALQTVEAQPFGSAILAAVALGLIAFGLFGMVEAVFRRIKAPRELDPG